MELKVTQKQVLKVLVNHREEFLGIEDIYKECKVNRDHIKRAVTFFVQNDYVYQPDMEGKVKISPDGVSLYYEHL